ncbi:PREDICTED: uncharacterized protein LOC109327686 [Lupinus angustifolius]|uniref:uncharacterized protein LOC109327686 n=1 Tax=Lupinus angustifolius TaxID=3871 RepID=UPI00092FB505|nr:PREDICTED: uncharacterized protein LOC109327686 [Lupinus angustifolius]
MMKIILALQQRKSTTDNPSTSHMKPQTTESHNKSNVHLHNATRKEKGDMNMWDSIEERLKVVEGANYLDIKNVFEMCLVSDVVLPPKFKVPEFEKYDGTTCPKIHLHTYARKMSAYLDNDKLLIHCFQESLVGIAITWYIHLEREKVKTFLDLSDAFIKQYKYNEDSAPDRTQLQNMSMRQNESFKEYAQRWRRVASQVLPRLEEDEQLAIFINTLHNPYFDRMIGNTTSDFNAFIKVGSRIEHNLKSGKIAGDQLDSNEGKSSALIIKEEEETNFLTNERKYKKPKRHHQNLYYKASYPYQNSYPYNTFQYHTSSQFPKHRPNTNQIHISQQTQNNHQSINAVYTQRNPYFDPFPISYAELFDQLQDQGMLTPMEGKVFEPPYPKWYDPAASCAYHYNITGHSIENCRDLKYKVQELIDSKWLDFGQATKNTKGNFLSNPER